MGRGMSRVGGLLRGFADGYNTTRGVLRDSAMATAANVDQETIETQRLGKETTPGAEGMIYDSDTGQYLPRYLDAGGVTAQGQAQQDGGAVPAGITPVHATETVTQYRLGGATQDRPFTEDAVAQHRLRGMSNVAMRYGDPLQAAQLDALAARRREAADNEEIRAVLAGGQPRGLERVEASGQPAPEAQGGASAGRPKQSYLETIGPRVMDAYLRQGKVAEAKTWRDFSESEAGRVYAEDFAKAQRLVTAGDYDNALPILQRIHERDLPDGQVAKLTNLGNGTWRTDVVDQSSGEVVNSKVLGAADLAKAAVNALSPVKLVEFMAQQEGKRVHEAATLDRQMRLEELRQQGQDARDERLATRLAAQGQRGRLTLTQERANAEIQAARDLIDSMDPAEVRRRSQKATNTGRENPDFDPAIARAANLYNRRMVGSDEWFDKRQGQQPGQGDFGGKPVAELTDDQLQRYARAAGVDGRAKISAEQTRRRFAGDQAMQGHTIGELTPKGYKVFDSQGRHIGYYR
jgi:hypothetical protein